MKKNLSKAINEIFQLTSFNSKQYPEYSKWFFAKMIPRLFDNTGDIFFILDKFSVAGMIIMKNTVEEKKICQVYTDFDYRNKGICSLLIERCFSILGTEKPLITIPEYCIDEFSGIIKRYNWEEYGVISDYTKKEIIFNNSNNKEEVLK